MQLTASPRGLRTVGKAKPAAVIETLADLTPDPRNARRHNPRNVGMLEKALGEVGAARSIVIDEHGVVLAGNATIEAAARAGIEKVQVVDADGETIIAVRRTGLTAKQKTRLALYDNRTAELADWDADVIADLMATERELLDGLFADDELAELLDDLGDPETVDAEPQIDRAAELNKKWQVKPGDLWRVGEHRLLCGDSTKREDVERVMENQKGQMAMTSPPYGVGKSYETKGIGPWFDTIRPVIKNVCQQVSIVCWQMGDLYPTGTQFIEPTLTYSVSMFGENGMRPLWIRVWEKQGINYGIGAYHLVTNKPAQQYEYIATFADDTEEIDQTDHEWIVGFATGNYKFTKRLSAADKKSWGYAGVWKIKTVSKNDVHVAMYPLELPTRCIKMHSDKSDLVLEPFCGSGTTMVACENLQRKCRGIEISPDYCAVILERMATAFPALAIERA